MSSRNGQKSKSNNALSIEQMIKNTKENIREAEISMEFADPEEHDNLEEKNQRRKHEIDRFKKQLK